MHGLSEHAIFLFLLQFAVLLAAARLLGAVARRFGQPSVLGELIAGIVLGPAVFGHVFPAAQQLLFPRDATQEHLLEMVSWLGMVLLILRTGLEVDVRLWRYLGRAAVLTSLLGIVVPYGAGFALGQWMPESLLVHGVNRTVFALFLATTLSISAVKVVAKTLLDLDLMRRDIGTVILAAAVMDDTAGWVLLSIVSSIAVSGSLSALSITRPLLATSGIVLLAATVGRKGVRAILRSIDRAGRLEHGMISAILVVTFAAAALTQRLGIHAAFGAFVAGVLVTESPRVKQTTLESLDSVILGVFAPMFFVYTGLKVTALALPPFPVVAAILGTAILAKVIGAGLGARLGGLGTASALAVGVGMSSRGSMELVVARIGQDIGVLSPQVYAAIVLVPIVTSLVTPILLRLTARSVKPAAAEAARLEGEAANQRALVAREGVKILAAVSGGPRSAQVLRLAAPIARLPGATVVAVAIAAGEASGIQRRKPLTQDAAKRAIAAFEEEEPLPDFHEKVLEALSPVAAVQEEIARGYDLVILGAGRRRTVANRILTAAADAGVNALVLAGESFPRRFTRILVATSGGVPAQGAAEVAVTYAKAHGAAVAAVNVIDVAADPAQAEEVGKRVLRELVEFGAQKGVHVHQLVKRYDTPARCILSAAEDEASDLIVMGVSPRVLGRRLFFGNTVEQVLNHWRGAVALFVPAARPQAKPATG